MKLWERSHSSAVENEVRKLNTLLSSLQSLGSALPAWLSGMRSTDAIAMAVVQGATSKVVVALRRRRSCFSSESTTSPPR